MNHARLLVVFLFLANTAQGSDQSLSGMGAMKCEDYLKYRKVPNEIFETNIISWMQGFLSGQNIERMERAKPEQRAAAQYHLPEAPEYLPYLDNFCQEKQKAPIWMGAVALDHSLEESIDPIFRAPKIN